MTILAEIDKGTERTARAFILKVIGQYDYAGVMLFGSRARHTHRPDSDADIAVLLHGHTGKFVDVKLAMADIAYDVLLETGIRIQPNKDRRSSSDCRFQGLSTTVEICPTGDADIFLTAPAFRLSFNR